jgi:hypothetical protein
VSASTATYPSGDKKFSETRGKVRGADQLSPLEDKPVFEKSLDQSTSWLLNNREGLINAHPVARRDYVIPTPMIRLTYNVARDRVYARRPGVVFYGETRAGKTTCAKSIKRYLTEEFKNVYVTLASARSTPRPQAGHVWRLILEGSGHVCSQRKDPNLLLRNVVADVQICTHSKHGNQYVLILDEVNLLGESDLVNLLELHNALDLIGIRMTTISFGQREIIDRITALMAQEKQQIVARFFQAPQRFVACDSLDSLKAFLSYFDEKTEWPGDPSCTYTQFFFPRAFSCGFRFYKYSAKIWDLLSAGCLATNLECTMDFISLTIEDICLSLWREDHNDFVIDDEDIMAALQAASVLPYSQI